LPDGVREAQSTDVPCTTIAMPDSIDRLKQTIGPKLSRDVRYGRNRAERLDGLTIEHATTLETAREMLSLLFELHARRWATKGDPGVLADEAVRAFHDRALPALLEADLLRLILLRVGGHGAAVSYSLHAAGRTYVYLTGFDPAFSAIGPGTLVLATALEAAMAEGDSVVDFLGGQEPYEYDWHAVERPRFTRHFHREQADRGPLDDR